MAAPDATEMLLDELQKPPPGVGTGETGVAVASVSERALQNAQDHSRAHFRRQNRYMWRLLGFSPWV